MPPTSHPFLYRSWDPQAPHFSPTHQPVFVSATTPNAVPSSLQGAHILWAPTESSSMSPLILLQWVRGPRRKDLSKIHSKSQPELGGQPGLWAPQPMFLPPHYNRAHAPNTDTEQSGPPFHREVDSMGRPFHVCLLGKSSHMKSIT